VSSAEEAKTPDILDSVLDRETLPAGARAVDRYVRLWLPSADQDARFMENSLALPNDLGDILNMRTFCNLDGCLLGRRSGGRRSIALTIW
jgi:hypothetical protein